MWVEYYNYVDWIPESINIMIEIFESQDKLIKSSLMFFILTILKKTEVFICIPNQSFKKEILYNQIKLASVENWFN